MSARSWGRAAAGLLVAGVGFGLAAYGSCAGVASYRYGRAPRPRDDEYDQLLDQFMPSYDVVERHHIRVAAPPAVTLSAARDQDLLRLPLVRAIIKTRELVLRTPPDERPQPRGLLASTLSMGWGVLAEVADHEIVMGAVTRPWEPNVTFHALSPHEFALFAEPGFVKIVWTLRVDAIDNETSIFRTETRAMATDAIARARFRRYWAFAAPGIALIRRRSLQPLRREAERRARMIIALRRARESSR